MDKFYVYVYLEPDGTPYYIGKGYDDRDTEHIGACRRKETRNECPDFYIKLREMLDAGIVDPPRRRLVINLSLPTARILEKFFIDALGRIDLGTGPLTNLTDGRKPGPKVKQRISRALRAFHDTMTPEEKIIYTETMSKAVSDGWAKQTPKERKRIAENNVAIQKANYAALTPEEKKQRIETRKRGFAAMTPEAKQHAKAARSKSMKAAITTKTSEEIEQWKAAIAKAKAARTPEEKQRETENRSKAQKARRVKEKQL